MNFQQIDRDDTTGAIRGVFPQAFLLHPKDQGYLSAGWLEFFAGLHRDCIAGFAAFLGKTRKVTAKQAFACGQVGDIKEACSQFGQRIRVVYEPEEDNQAYTAIRRYQSDNLELLELLATDAWSRVTDARDVVELIGPWPRRW